MLDQTDTAAALPDDDLALFLQGYWSRAGRLREPIVWRRLASDVRAHLARTVTAEELDTLPVGSVVRAGGSQDTWVRLHTDVGDNWHGLEVDDYGYVEHEGRSKYLRYASSITLLHLGGGVA